MVTDYDSVPSYKKAMRFLGFGNFKWFRKWHGGSWYLFCSFHDYVGENCKKEESRYPDRFVTKDFRFVLCAEYHGE
jgi:hypothetical protein